MTIVFMSSDVIAGGDRLLGEIPVALSYLTGLAWLDDTGSGDFDHWLSGAGE
ncbi:MAG: hypothetical protein KUG81_05195 [Gammaproteobacteria bacterium]|nr:hypothetical protein [Gammaproteobacteria bacterium]